MKTSTTKSTGLIVFWLLAFASLTQAHSWVEQLTVIAPNGTFIGPPGFPRGNMLRTSPGFNDGSMTNLIPPNGRSTGNAILATDLICKSTQTIGNQTPGSPALTASPGDMIALRYQENGHVTIPETQQGKPSNRGTVFIYGTTKPSNSDTLLSIHRVWTADGKGGDGRGVLLATRNFDDGQCYQVNGHPISTQRQTQFPHTPNTLMGVNLWCQTDVTLPASLPESGSYALYWVWDWPTAPGTEGFPNGLNETYTTCMDINMSAKSGNSKAAGGVQFAKGQDLNYAAIESELSTAFIVSATGGSPAAAATASATQPSAESSVTTSKPSTAPAPIAAGGGNLVSTVTVTESIKDTVTIYRTVAPSASSISVQPFLAAPTTLTAVASKSTPSEMVVTTVKKVLVMTTMTVYATSSPPPKIRGRSVR